MVGICSNIPGLKIEGQKVTYECEPVPGNHLRNKETTAISIKNLPVRLLRM